ncbi:MAG TPA: radical SAM protein [Bacteroidetes bacterium]|nr:radical SAM protein [Bacteroidota bacterium]
MDIHDEMPRRRGRATTHNPQNRFETHRVQYDPAALAAEDLRQITTETFLDTSKSILSKNDSPDIPFTFGINPYRGCEHGCVYCYARPSHEYLGFSAGLDFETKILYKPDSPKLLEEAFRAKNWIPQQIALSGNTDCYQPLERNMQITRKLLTVFCDFRNPVGIITKNALITRDIDLLQDLAKQDLVITMLSVTTLRDELVNKMEPRTSRPLARLKAIESLALADIPVGVMVAPVIPGLTHEEIPEILKAARDYGAEVAGYQMVRLPGTVRELFIEWLDKELPLRAQKIKHRLEDLHGKELRDSRFGHRMRGKGIWAETVRHIFRVAHRKNGYSTKFPKTRTDLFQVPPKNGDQLRLF